MRRPDHKASYFSECLICERLVRSLASRPRLFCSRACYVQFRKLSARVLRNDILRREIIAWWRDQLKQAA